MYLHVLPFLQSPLAHRMHTPGATSSCKDRHLTTNLHVCPLTNAWQYNFLYSALRPFSGFRAFVTGLPEASGIHFR